MPIGKAVKDARKCYNRLCAFSKPLALYEASNVLRGNRKPKNMREAQPHFNFIVYAVSKQIPETLEKYESIAWVAGTPHEDSAPIWVCWLDGPDALPAFCSRCVRSICDHAGNHPIKFVDSGNVDAYVSIPKRITELKNRGLMSLPNYCDILRVALLWKYGGLWLDADIFVSKDIPDAFFSKPFVSEKNDYFDLSPVNACKHVAQGKWNATVLGGWKGNTFIGFILDALIEYSTKNDRLLTYTLIDYCIELARRRFPAAARTISETIDNGRYQKLRKAMADGMPASDLAESIPKETIFNSLDWKIQYPTVTADGGETVYSAFMKMPVADIEYLRSCRLV